MKCLFTTFFVFVLIKLCAGACNQPTNIPSGSYWVANDGCKNGTTYDTQTNPQYHCHCWSFCGYICDPKNGTTTTTTTTKASTTTTTTTPTTTLPSSTTTSATTSKPGCKFGSPWFPPNKPNTRCVCKSFNKQPYYECTDMTTTTTAATNTTTTAVP